MKHQNLHSLSPHTSLRCAGQILQAVKTVNPESRWKVVADKVGDSEGEAV